MFFVPSGIAPALARRTIAPPRSALWCIGLGMPIRTLAKSAGNASPAVLISFTFWATFPQQPFR